MSKTIKDKIVNAIKESENLKKSDINDALDYQKEKGISLERAFVEKNLIKEEDLLILFVRELNLPFIKLSKYKIDPALKEILSEKTARQYKVVPLSSLDYTMTIAISDPLNVFAIDDIKNITGKEIDIMLSTTSEIQKVLDSFYGNEIEVSVSEITQDIQLDDFEIVSDNENDNDDTNVDEGEKAPVIRMVNLIIKEALKQRASDIHMEPTLEGMRVRYRVDGALLNILNVPKESQNAAVVRIKIMSRMDITSNNTPQDGRFKLVISGKEVDFRVSILPTTFGQKVVMRVLDKGNLSVGLDGLGMSGKSLEVVKESMRKPFGMLLVTGPTGSGKSTTLYSIINKLNTVDKNIVTVEDPVEYLVEGLTQIQARPEIGLTFAAGLRAILRQSPDIVMVGEIRDNETADIAIKASLTGQLVLSTLHTNDAAGALTRLVDMGVEPFLVASSIVMVSAQRLCRKICEKCKKPIEISQKVLDEIDYEFEKGMIFYQGEGCEACRDTGCRGRICVTEVMDVDDDVRNMLLRGESSDVIKKYVCEEKGMVTLWGDAMSKCISGIISLEEVLRVTTSE